MKTLTTAVLTVGLLAAAGCKTQTLVGRERPPSDGGPGAQTPNNNEDASSPLPDVGNTPGKTDDAAASSNSDGDADERETSPPPNPDPPFTIPDAYVGEWTGYFQAFTLRSGSDAIAFNLIRTPGAPDRITVTLGAGPSPMVSGIDPPQPEPLKGKPTRFSPEYFEAFPYTAHQVKWNDSRLTFQIAISEPYGMWCQKQTSSGAGNGTYNCIPSGSINYDGTKDECTSADVVVSCARFWACLARVCSCEASGCMAAPSPTSTFDVTFEPFASGATNLELSQYFRLTRKQTDGGVAESGQ